MKLQMSEREPLSEDQQPFASADDSDSVSAHIVGLFFVIFVKYITDITTNRGTIKWKHLE